MEVNKNNDWLHIRIRDEIENILIKEIRKHERIQALWMSGGSCVATNNILYMLPSDLCKSITELLWKIIFVLIFMRVFIYLYT